MRIVSGMPGVDAVKGIACLLIVLHHLAFYGSMSDIAYPLMPALIDLFYQYGRMAVQVFFVIAVFLMAVFGIAIALGANIAAGGLLFNWVEHRPRARRDVKPPAAAFAVSRLATPTTYR